MNDSRQRPGALSLASQRGEQQLCQWKMVTASWIEQAVSNQPQ
ncbi:hypothetical protein C4K15_3600 [Pseudomonas chlororaphis subsp. aurantiaca]|nr:hypothetical protein C4K15_3600 [Pseudomonas chlororaphis subsp. aurantiaca]